MESEKRKKMERKKKKIAMEFETVANVSGSEALNSSLTNQFVLTSAGLARDENQK